MSAADMDLDALLQSTAAELVVRHPVTGAPTSARITIAGVEHPARKAAVFQRMRARRAEVERTGRMSIPDPEDDEADEVALLAACTLGWNLTKGGEPLAFSAEAARTVYGNPAWRWLRNQVKAGLDQNELFFEGSASA